MSFDTESMLIIASASTPGEAAAMWWFYALRGGPKLDNSEDLESFRIILAKKIDHLLTEKDRISMTVDYHLDHLLSAVAKEAGFSTGSFADQLWKIRMWVKPDSVVVSNGRSELVHVWTK